MDSSLQFLFSLLLNDFVDVVIILKFFITLYTHRLLPKKKKKKKNKETKRKKIKQIRKKK